MRRIKNRTQEKIITINYNSSKLGLMLFICLSLCISLLYSSKAFSMGYFKDEPSIFDYEGINAFKDVLNQHSMPFDESSSASMQEKVKQVDNALIQAMMRLDIDLEKFKVENSYIRLDAETVFLFQKIRLYLPDGISAVDWTKAITEQVNLWAHSTQVKTDYKNNKTSILINNQLTHEIYYRALDTSAKLSIVIDDLGNNLETNLALLSLEFPITFAVLPDTRYPEITSTIAHFARREVFLHQPMEARNNAFAVPIGFRINDTRDEIRTKLIANLEKTPYASGLNNQTGSAFSENEVAVINFLAVLKDVNPALNVLDSYTIAGSHIYPIAKDLHFNTKRRDIFLDNVQDIAEITKQLDKALLLALQNPNEHIVAIGHPYKSTLSALQAWNSYKSENVEIIPVFLY